MLAAVVAGAVWLVYAYNATGEAGFLGYLAGVNVAVLLFYWLDKRAARQKDARVPEVVLYAMSVLGGLAAAVVAQQFLRHKTQKMGFRRLTVVVFCGLYVLAFFGLRALLDRHDWPAQGWEMIAAAAAFAVVWPAMNMATAVGARGPKRKRMAGWLWGGLVLAGGSPAPALGGMLGAWSYSPAKVRFVTFVFAAHTCALTWLAWGGLGYLLARL